MISVIKGRRLPVFSSFFMGLILLALISLFALVFSGCVSDGNGDDSILEVPSRNTAPPIVSLDPQALADGSCDYLDTNVLNNIFNKIPEKVYLDERTAVVEQTDLWEFNEPGMWREGIMGCNWKSTNTAGVSILILGKKIPPDTNLETTESYYFVEAVDALAKISERYILPDLLADEIVKLEISSSGGLGGFALRWNYYAVHIHVLSENDPPDSESRMLTEERAEIALAGYLLRSFEEFQNSSP